jgi:subtilisin family serine protease
MATRKKGVRAQTTAGDGGANAPRRPTRLVYMHGVGVQEPRDRLRRQWDLALFGRELGDTSPVGESRMAYWTDLILPKAAAGRSSTSWARREFALDADPGRLDLQAVRRDFDLPAAADTADEERLQRLWAQLLRRFEIPAGSGPSAKILYPLPRWVRRPITKIALRMLLGQFAAYFLDQGRRYRIRQRLDAELPVDGSEDVVLVTHSLGTVIAYDVLTVRARQGRPVHVRQFVTLGSPLGIDEVQDFTEEPLAVPSHVRQWLNYCDPLDLVALDKGLTNDFAPGSHDDGAGGSRRIVRVEDTVLMNRLTPRGNPHAAAGYLSHPKVKRAVADAARIDSMRQFLVARDVAAEFDDLEQRQAVLFEIREPGSSADAGLPAADRALSLAERVDRAALDIERIVRETAAELAEPESTAPALAAVAVDEARIDRLQRFVAARLLPTELLTVATRHEDLFVYTVWKSTRKRKLVERTARVVQADAARESYGASGRGVAWAVLDTGIQADHPHFNAFTTHPTIAAVWDCTRPGKPTNLLAGGANDRDGHGTHVAGILAGEGLDHSGARRRGIAPEATLHVYKVLDDDGTGEDAWIIKALDHIADCNDNASRPRIHGINLSLGGPFDSTVYGCGFSPVCQELRRLWRNGVLVVVASGNEGKVEVETGDGAVELNSPMSIGDPANLEECIAVGSVHADKPHLYGISGFSSRGPTADGRAKPDCVAPGERILSCNAHHAHEPADSKGRYYRAESGTSMAAPAVSGLLAAFLSARREFLGRPDEVKALLLRTCTDLGRDRYHQGRGMPNLMKMLLES